MGWNNRLDAAPQDQVGEYYSFMELANLSSVWPSNTTATTTDYMVGTALDV